ncbi:hypothetical protein B0H13DRAFT_1604505, partial [Mycena leptocephala]
GIYLVLFCICIYILLHRPHNLGNTILLVTAIALFTLSTVQAVINLVLGAADIDDIDIPYDQLVDATTIIYGVNKYEHTLIISISIIADGLVVSPPIYRCYSVWNYNKYVVVLPIIMLIVTSGLLFAVDLQLPENPYFALSLATNVVVTIFTAGRIWWICRQSRAYLKTDEQRRYISVISIIVESGVIYSATVLVYLILSAIPSAVILQEPIYQMLTQVLGIAPTLIIVRVGLGVHVQSFESTVGTAVAKSENARPHKRPILGIHISKPYFDNALPSPPQDVEKGQPNYGSGRPWSF